MTFDAEQLTNAYLIKRTAALKTELDRIKRSTKSIGRLVRDKDNQIVFRPDTGVTFPAHGIDVFIKADVFDGAGMLVTPLVDL